MRSKFLFLSALLMLAGCNGRAYQPIKTEYKVVKPDESMYVCNVSQLPDPSTLTDVQVAALINDLYANASICKNNMEAIHKYLDTAEKIFQSK